MNLVYIIFIIIIVLLLITGFIVNVIENREKKIINKIVNESSENDIEVLELSDDSSSDKINDGNFVLSENNTYSTNSNISTNYNNIDNTKKINANNILITFFGVDSIEKLEKSIEFKVNNKSKNYYVPQLHPYSIVDDDVI